VLRVFIERALGGTVREMVQQYGQTVPLDPVLVSRVMRQLGKGLIALKKAGLVHLGVNACNTEFDDSG